MKKLIPFLCLHAVLLLFSCSQSDKSAFVKRKYFDFAKNNHALVIRESSVAYRNRAKNLRSDSSTISKNPSIHEVTSVPAGTVLSAVAKKPFINNHIRNLGQTPPDSVHKSAAKFDQADNKKAKIISGKSDKDEDHDYLSISGLCCGIIAIALGIVGFIVGNNNESRTGNTDSSGDYYLGPPGMPSTLILLMGCLSGIIGLVLSIKSLRGFGHKRAIAYVGVFTAGVALIIAVLAMLFLLLLYVAQ